MTVAERIRHLEAELRQLERAGAAGDRLAELDHTLAYWRQVKADQVASGEVVSYDNTTVQAGDRVRTGNRWYTVARVNQRTVSVSLGPGSGGRARTATLPFHKIVELRGPAG